MDKEKFQFAKNKIVYQYTLLQKSNFIKDFLKRFFTNKTSVFSLAIFIFLILFLGFGRFLSPYSATMPINNNDTNLYIGNLPPSYIATKHLIVSNENLLQEFQKLNQANPAINLTINTLLGNQKYISFDFEQLLKTVNQQEFVKPILGTNYVGYDVWNQTLISGMNSLVLALSVAFLEMVFGVIIGSFLGFYNNKNLVNLISKIVDVLNSVPTLIWFTILVIVLPKHFLSLYLSFLVIGWSGPCYWSRFYILKFKDRLFIQASQALGSPNWRIILYSALPHYLGKIIALFARRVTFIIFFAASISFVGFDDATNFPTIGKVFVNAMQGYQSNFWQLLFPGILMALLTFSIQFIAFGIEKALNAHY